MDWHCIAYNRPPTNSYSTVKKVSKQVTLREETFAEESFAISGTIQESLFLRNNCYLSIAKVYSREKNKSFKLAKVKKSKNLNIYII